MSSRLLLCSKKGCAHEWRSFESNPEPVCGWCGAPGWVISEEPTGFELMLRAMKAEKSKAVKR